jgi:hypothetical protein
MATSSNMMLNSFARSTRSSRTCVFQAHPLSKLLAFARHCTEAGTHPKTCAACIVFIITALDTLSRCVNSCSAL